MHCVAYVHIIIQKLNLNEHVYWTRVWEFLGWLPNTCTISSHYIFFKGKSGKTLSIYLHIYHLTWSIIHIDVCKSIQCINDAQLPFNNYLSPYYVLAIKITHIFCPNTRVEAGHTKRHTFSRFYDIHSKYLLWGPLRGLPTLDIEGILPQQRRRHREQTCGHSRGRRGRDKFKE